MGFDASPTPLFRNVGKEKALGIIEIVTNHKSKPSGPIPYSVVSLLTSYAAPTVGRSGETGLTAPPDRAAPRAEDRSRDPNPLNPCHA